MSKDLFYEMREGSFYNHEQDTSTYWEEDNMVCRLEHESEIDFINSVFTCSDFNS